MDGDAASELILIVDDEPRMIEMTGIALEAQGLRWIGAANTAEAWDVLLNHDVALIVLDVMLPNESGLDFCRRLRPGSSVPVVLLSALGSTEERVAGLEAGADDYIAKPFSPRELALRVQAVLRRHSRTPAPEPAVTARHVGDLVLDPALLSARLAGRDTHVSPGEFKLLWLLADHVGRTVHWRDLFAALGNPVVPFGGQEAVRTAIYRLRLKLDPHGQTRPILTDRGVGYRLRPPH